MTQTSSHEGQQGRSVLAVSAELFAISFVLLFFELTCIRWFASYAIFLTFFTNIVLLACVLGMSIGCLAARRPLNFLLGLYPLTLLAIILALVTLYAYKEHGWSVDVGNQSSPEQIYFGTESQSGAIPRSTSVEWLAGGFFGLIALIFVGLGQAMGRAFDAIPGRIRAYTINIAGSLAGIVAFAIVSYAWAPPLVWFTIALLPTAWFLRSLRPAWAVLQLAALASILLVVNRAPESKATGESQLFWSPYYKVDFFPGERRINTNNIGHQTMVDIGPTGGAYLLPYLLRKGAGVSPPGKVLVIGAGSGNDVQAALLQGVRHVDAVEIDPVLNQLGKRNHPNRPYDDPRVSVHVDDGRGFLKHSVATYDQIVYAFVDSLVLHSGYSSLRLESFLFTEEAFRDIKQRLAPDGVLVMYNYYRQGWVIGRLAKMAEKVFGTRPLVFSLPHRPKIDIEKSQGSLITMLMVGRDDRALDAVRRRFEENEWYWLHQSPKFNLVADTFGEQPPEVPGAGDQYWNKIGPAELDTSSISLTPSDNWPFLYLREPSIPWFLFRGMLFMSLISLVLLRLLAPEGALWWNGRMFFLGAAFMLLETKGVVHLALLFGSTWIVNSIVFAAILSMILLSNLYVMLARPRNLTAYYVLLIASLIANAVVPMSVFLSMQGAARIAASCGLVFVPIFFAGVIFATSFRDSRQPDLDFGANICGVVLGGLTEYLSLVVGLNGLILIACGYYLASAVLGPRGRPSPAG